MSKYKSGLENLLEKNIDILKNKRIALVTNHTGLTKDLENNIDLLDQNEDINLVKLFGPEHGVRGNAAAGAKVESSRDPKTGLEVVSLYGKNKKPSSKMLSGIDAVVFDIQDLGLRFYTYLSTMFYLMESCAENQVELIILDRLNPLGRKVEGNIVEDKFSSFIGLYPVPHRHGMTFAELAQWANQEHDLNTDLTIVKCSGWNGENFAEIAKRDNLFWIPPSPGIPTFKSALAYPISCMLEGTNISEGRGTTKPFEYIGAPWIDSEKLAEQLENEKIPGLRFRPVYFIPDASKHQGKECGGVQILIKDSEKVNSYFAALTIIKEIFRLYPEKTNWLKPQKKGHKYFFDLLMGTDTVRKKINQGYKVNKILESWQTELNNFCQKRNKYLIY